MHCVGGESFTSLHKISLFLFTEDEMSLFLLFPFKRVALKCSGNASNIIIVLEIMS